MNPAALWKRGKSAPFFRAATTESPEFYFDTVAGRCVVLMFYGSLEIEKNRESLRAVYTDLRQLFDDKRALFFGVCVDPADPSKGVKNAVPGIRFFWDYDLSVCKLYGATPQDQKPIGQGSLRLRSFTLVLDSRLRVYDCIPIDSAEQHTSRLRASVEALLAEEKVVKEWVNAPVLIVPNIFPARFCEHLILMYQSMGGSTSGTMTVKDGQTVGRINRNFKRRLDCTITDSATIRKYRSYLIENLFPQIQRAFNFSPAHIERYMIACYDGGDRGFFSPHRDNMTPATSHRRFACTINLNSADYTGGDLRFPEYSQRTYRAPTGGAVVFSGSILHEVLPVTCGQRFATLPFIHDDAAEVVRQRNAGSLGQEVIRVE